MTEFKAYPTLNVAFQPHHRSQGMMRLVFRGDGSVGAMQDSGNRVSFRGVDYSVHLEFTVVDGKATATGKYDSIKRYKDWAPAPPTFEAKIREEVAALVEAAWTPQWDREGLEADVAQDLCRLERTHAELVEKLSAVSHEVRAAKRRLECADGQHDWMPIRNGVECMFCHVTIID